MPGRHDDTDGPSLVHAARREYDAGAAAYDRRWADYTRRSLELLRPRLTSGSVGRLLDVGCGTASLAEALAGWGARPERYVGVDVAPEMLGVARGKVAALPFPCEFATASVDELPQGDAAFDTVVSASSLHRWPDVGRGLREIRRVLRPGGRVVLLDWCADSLSIRGMAAWLRVGRGIRVRPLRTAELEAALRDAGFGAGRASRARISPLWGLMAVEGAAR